MWEQDAGGKRKLRLVQETGYQYEQELEGNAFSARMGSSECTVSHGIIVLLKGLESSLYLHSSVKTCREWSEGISGISLQEAHHICLWLAAEPYQASLLKAFPAHGGRGQFLLCDCGRQ